MPLRPRFLCFLAFAALLGCGDQNLLDGLADDDSEQALLEEAHMALNDGDCEKAVELFTQLQAAHPDDVGLRMDLSAALMCRAGFSVTEFLAIAADRATAGSGVTDQNVFQVIADGAVTLLDPGWPTDTDNAITLLSPYIADPDVAFNLAIIEMVKAVMTVVDILNYVDGSVNCTASPDCEMTAADAQAIADALQEASDLLAGAGITSEATNTIDTILTDMNSASPLDPISCSDIQMYLFNQGVDPGNQLQCV